jgi:hypothetical protein
MPASLAALAERQMFDTTANSSYNTERRIMCSVLCGPKKTQNTKRMRKMQQTM